MVWNPIGSAFCCSGDCLSTMFWLGRRTLLCYSFVHYTVHYHFFLTNGFFTPQWPLHMRVAGLMCCYRSCREDKGDDLFFICPGCFLFYSCCKISHFRENMKRMRRRMPLSNSFQSWFNFSAANRCRLSINLEWLSNNVRLFYLLVWWEIARPKGAFIQRQQVEA